MINTLKLKKWGHINSAPGNLVDTLSYFLHQSGSV
jgi:hypothetical protein